MIRRLVLHIPQTARFWVHECYPHWRVTNGLVDVYECDTKAEATEQCQELTWQREHAASEQATETKPIIVQDARQAAADLFGG